jgi:undecaprenyl pyrophosphate phosphatase UppP
VYKKEFRSNNKVLIQIFPDQKKRNFFYFSVVGVLKSVLQIFFGLFVFDRLAINLNTIIGIALSLCAGTIFSYLEYTAKKNKSTTSMNNIDSEQGKPLFDTQDLSTNSEKFVHTQ